MSEVSQHGEGSKRPPIPVTCFTGFLGAGKTTTILGLLTQLPKDYKVVLLKNEYGDQEVDSLLVQQSNITGVSEILNGCLCCTMVGLVENALIEIRDKYAPDRIIIESSGSAFPATLALQIRQLEPEGFRLDGILTVIDCVNFRGYEDTSPSAKLQARYTDLLLLSKYALCSEMDLDRLQDHLSTLNDETPRLKVGPDAPLTPDIAFGLDTKLFELAEGESAEWAQLAVSEGAPASGWHGDEVETRTVWRGGRHPAARKGKSKAAGQGGEHIHANGEAHHGHHAHENGHTHAGEDEGEVDEGGCVEQAELEAALSKLSFEIYRVKGLVRLSTTTPDPNSNSDTGTDIDRGKMHILNYAFGRHELTAAPALDDETKEDLRGVALRLTVMGERGEVARRAKRFAEAVAAQVA